MSRGKSGDDIENNNQRRRSAIQAGMTVISFMGTSLAI